MKVDNEAMVLMDGFYKGIRYGFSGLILAGALTAYLIGVIQAGTGDYSLYGSSREGALIAHTFLSLLIAGASLVGLLAFSANPRRNAKQQFLMCTYAFSLVSYFMVLFIQDGSVGMSVFSGFASAAFLVGAARYAYSEKDTEYQSLQFGQ